MAHVAQQRRQEEREGLHGDIDGEEAESADGVVDVEDGALDVLQLDLFVHVRTVLAEETLCGDLLFAGREELALVRVCLHEDWSDQSNDDCEQAFEEEDVAPGVQFHGCDAELGDSNETCGEQSTEGSCERTGRDEDSDAEQEFVPLVEARQEECNAGHGTALSETEESASNVQSGVCLDECCAHRAEAEGEDQEWDPESRTDGLEDDV